MLLDQVKALMRSREPELALELAQEAPFVPYHDDPHLPIHLLMSIPLGKTTHAPPRQHETTHVPPARSRNISRMFPEYSSGCRFFSNAVTKGFGIPASLHITYMIYRISSISHVIYHIPRVAFRHTSSISMYTRYLHA